MRCHICDAILEPHEIVRDPRDGKFKPCGTCLSVIDDMSEEDEDGIEVPETHPMSDV